MADSPLKDLEACGTAVWSDYIKRSFVRDGGLRRLVEEDGVSGVTSNPTIFEKAIGGGDEYDDQLEELARAGKSTEEIFRELVGRDIAMGADVLRPVYNRTTAYDGYISVEVSPAAAHDTEKTLEDARWFWTHINRPNIMIKVPATPEGIPAIEQLISEGINVNITLIFAVEVYETVMEAYIRGLERRVEQGGAVDRIASVASFFVSRVDTLVDRLLDEQTGHDDERRALAGKAAVANARIAYERFEAIFESERFKKLAASGAQVQRPLWASTSTKNPDYPDTKYVDELVGRHTVNTMPLDTIDAVRDHGKITCDTVTQDVAEAHEVVKRLGAVGISMSEVTDQLTREGVKSFLDSLHSLYETLEKKAQAVSGGERGGGASNLGGLQSTVTETLGNMQQNGFVQRLWDKDPGLWKPDPSQQDEISDRLGWLHVSDHMLEHRKRLLDIAAWARERRFTHAVVLGMGGSSLAPLVLAQTFGRQEGYPELLVLDSTDPEAVFAIERSIAADSTLFIVSSKSGTTTEPNAFMETFWAMVTDRIGDRAGEQFVAITDPGTPLAALALERGFHEVFLNPSDIGGRYSAMSFFGMVPAAVMGLDVERLLDGSVRMERACAPAAPVVDNPGARLGVVMAEAARAGRDKVTFILGTGLESFGLWLEQLLAESTGKEGTGLVPVPDTRPGDAEDYGSDRLFTCLYLKGKGPENEHTVTALEGAGHPVVRMEIADPYDLGGEFFRWEFATAVAGALLQINAFNQPNVQESKDNTKRLLKEFEQRGELPARVPVAESGGVKFFVTGNGSSDHPDAEQVLARFLHGVAPPRYVALMAYLAPNGDHDAVLAKVQETIRHALLVAVTVGYGPRFLHSTGQLHKGGPDEGVFVQITARHANDDPVPGEKYSYATLIEAQALGDFEALGNHGRQVLGVELPDESDESMRRFADLLAGAIRQPAGSR